MEGFKKVIKIAGITLFFLAIIGVVAVITSAAFIYKTISFEADERLFESAAGFDSTTFYADSDERDSEYTPVAVETGGAIRKTFYSLDEISPYLKVEDLVADRVQQKKLYLCVKLVRGRRKASQYKMVALPTSLPRLYDLDPEGEKQCLIRLEDIIKHYAYRLFPREEVEHVAVFRVLRNQNFPVVEETRADVVPAVREMLGKRLGGAVMRLEAEERMSEEMLTLLMKMFNVELERRYRVTGPLDLNKMLMSLYSMVKRPELKFENVKPLDVPELMGDDVLTGSTSATGFCTIPTTRLILWFT